MIMNKKLELNIFCQNVRILRENNNLSKKEMAEKLGISTKSLNKIESGVVPKRLSCDILAYIYLNFGVDVIEIFTPIEK